MRKLPMLLLALFAAFALSASSAQASVVNWSQPFNESGTASPFASIETFMNVGSTGFAQFDSFSATGWSANIYNGTYVLATGPATSNTDMVIGFDTPQSQPFGFVFLAWDGAPIVGRLLDSANVAWTGSGWNITAFNGDVSLLGRSTAAPVPEPGTMMLLGSGLVGLVGYGRKKIKGGALSA